MPETPDTIEGTTPDYFAMSGPHMVDYCGADAMRWAEAFVATKKKMNWTLDQIAEGLMLGWFANAIETAESVRHLPQPALETNMTATDYSGRMHDGSLGAHRVRESFNPSADSMVDKIKRQSADLIDLCEQLRREGDGEQARLVSLAQTHYEDAAMWAVKAATTPK